MKESIVPESDTLELPRISVIVPVYNVEGFIERCVGSILAQTHSEMDIVLVDDGSTDISGTICDIYAELESRVRTFHTPHKGLSAARNFGIEKALEAGSPLLAFVDADDFIEPEMFSRLLSALTLAEADIAQCGFFVDGLRTKQIQETPSAIWNKREALAALLNGRIPNLVWNKLYRSSLFETIRFPEGRNFEDVATTYRWILKCDTVVSISYVGYHYAMRENSISHTHDMPNLADFWLASLDCYNGVNDAASLLLDTKMKNDLAQVPANAIARMWRQAFATGREERRRFDELLRGMQVFERRHLRHVDKRDWPLKFTGPLFLFRSRSTWALASCYFASRFFLALFPGDSWSRR